MAIFRISETSCGRARPQHHRRVPGPQRAELDEIRNLLVLVGDRVLLADDRDQPRKRLRRNGGDGLLHLVHGNSRTSLLILLSGVDRCLADDEDHDARHDPAGDDRDHGDPDGANPPLTPGKLDLRPLLVEVGRQRIVVLADRPQTPSRAFPVCRSPSDGPKNPSAGVMPTCILVPRVACDVVHFMSFGAAARARRSLIASPRPSIGTRMTAMAVASAAVERAQIGKQVRRGLDQIARGREVQHRRRRAPQPGGRFGPKASTASPALHRRGVEPELRARRVVRRHHARRDQHLRVHAAQRHVLELGLEHRCGCRRAAARRGARAAAGRAAPRWSTRRRHASARRR